MARAERKRKNRVTSAVADSCPRPHSRAGGFCRQPRPHPTPTTSRPTATGPTSLEGKLVSRGNAVKHGFTAKLLARPDEDPEYIRACFEYWRQHYRPQGADEEALVDEIALTSLRLESIASVESATVDDQVRDAQSQWDRKQNDQFLEFRRTLRRDRMAAMYNLRSIGAGVSWLLARWEVLESAVNRTQCWRTVASIREAILLRGFHDENVSSGFELAHLAVSCIDDHENTQELLYFLQNYNDEGAANVESVRGMQHLISTMASYIPDECLSRAGVREMSVAEARRTMRSWLDRQMADLRAFDRHFKEADAETRANARTRARVVADTPENRLLLRYMRSAKLSRNRAIKTLTRLQAERRERAKKGEDVDLPNEPVVAADAPAKKSSAGSCVTTANAYGEFEHVSFGTSTMNATESTAAQQPWEVAATTPNGV